MPAASSPSILFVCLGNICRSPTAEGIARVRAAESGMAWTFDSAGTSAEHSGHAPDPRARAVASEHGTPIDDLRARQVSADDFRQFDHIIAMDHSNLANLKRIAPADATARLSLLLDYLPGREGQDVADPWYGDEKDFYICWDDCNAAVQAMLESLPTLHK